MVEKDYLEYQMIAKMFNTKGGGDNTGIGGDTGGGSTGGQGGDGK